MVDFSQFEYTPEPIKARKDEAKITIDTREGKSTEFFVRQLMQKYERQNIVSATLKVGDFTIESNDGNYIVVIERKSAKDFVASHYGKRLESQSPEIANYDHGVIAIHDDLYDENVWKIPINKGGRTVWVKRRSFSYPETVTRTISSYALRTNPEGNRPALVQLQDKMAIVDHVDYYAKLIEKGRLIRHRQDIKGKGKNKMEQHKSVLLNRTAQFPNTGHKRAIGIMELANWSESRLNELTIEELKSVSMVGEKTATKIWETLHAEEYSE